MGKNNLFQRIIAGCLSFVIVLSLIFSNTTTAFAIEVDAGSTPGSGGGTGHSQSFWEQPAQLMVFFNQ